MLFSADQTVKCSYWFRCWASFSPARGGQGQGCPQESRESPGRTIPGSRVSWLKTTAGKPWQGNWQVNYRLSDKYKWLWRWQWQKRLFYSTLLYTKCITCTQSPKSPTMELTSMVTRDANNTPHYALSIFENFFFPICPAPYDQENAVKKIFDDSQVSDCTWMHALCDSRNIGIISTS